MRNNTTPSPDGLNAAFYKSSWNLVKDDVHNLVVNFILMLLFLRISLMLIRTFITCIPKKNQPLIPQDYRPIGLCNVIYKIIAKSDANKVKVHLTDYISYSQAAFVAGRHISCNFIITQEIIHSFNLKSWTDHGFILKLDLAKAFDRIKWSFISTALHKIGFTNHFINIIQAYISTSSLPILVNNEPTVYFHP
jgi:hypothetical protein